MTEAAEEVIFFRRKQEQLIKEKGLSVNCKQNRELKLIDGCIRCLESKEH
jgi:hypothetical protein